MYKGRYVRRCSVRAMYMYLSASAVAGKPDRGAITSVRPYLYLLHQHASLGLYRPTGHSAVLEQMRDLTTTMTVKFVQRQQSQKSCTIAKMTARCAHKSKQTATVPLLHLRSLQPDVMDVDVERTFSPPNFSMSPGSRWMSFGLQSEDVGLIVRAISFQDFQPMWP